MVVCTLRAIQQDRPQRAILSLLCAVSSCEFLLGPVVSGVVCVYPFQGLVCNHVDGWRLCVVWGVGVIHKGGGGGSQGWWGSFRVRL